jgi:hypothetical protein
MGLTPQQHQALLAIKGAPDDLLSIKQIVERLLVRHHTVAARPAGRSRHGSAHD